MDIAAKVPEMMVMVELGVVRALWRTGLQCRCTALAPCADCLDWTIRRLKRRRWQSAAMDLRTRGIVVAVLIVASAVFITWDGVVDGFSVRDWIALACMAIVLLYSLNWIRRPVT